MKHLLVGTNKGLVVYRMNGTALPEFEAVHFPGFAVSMVHHDTRHDRTWVGVAHKHWGQKLHYSDDRGKNWHSTPMPKFNGAEMPDGKKAKVRSIWCLQHSGSDRPNDLWLGTEPGGLFFSNNNGESFELVQGLWNHPSRTNEGQWFGTGSDNPFIHSIVVDPNDSDHVYVAVSCAGVFETTDGGQNWHPRNKGLVAAYLPNPDAEVGHDPHLLLMSPANPDIMWQQNHCGVFYSDDAGQTWNDVSAKEGLPSYGFALAVDEENAGKAWVIPVESDEQRMAPNFALEVYQTENFGQSWEQMSHGLPKEQCFDIVLRQSFAKHGEYFAFGTTNGNLYTATTGLLEWQLVTANLTKVNTLTFA